MSNDYRDYAEQPLRLFGRRKGKRLRVSRRALLVRELEQVRIDPAKVGRPCYPGDLFLPSTGTVWLEIGFGGGEHLAAQAKAHPDIGFIGAEIFENGIASLLHHRQEGGLNNIRVLDDDVRAFLPLLADRCLGRVFLFFPDPWPKARHAKRRFICPESLDELARVMPPGAELRIATDHPVFANWCLRHGPVHPSFRWAVTGPDDWRQRPADATATRYEEKARKEGRQPVYLTFVRKSP